MATLNLKSAELTELNTDSELLKSAELILYSESVEERGKKRVQRDQKGLFVLRKKL